MSEMQEFIASGGWKRVYNACLRQWKDALYDLRIATDMNQVIRARTAMRCAEEILKIPSDDFKVNDREGSEQRNTYNAKVERDLGKIEKEAFESSTE